MNIRKESTYIKNFIQGFLVDWLEAESTYAPFLFLHCSLGILSIFFLCKANSLSIYKLFLSVTFMLSQDPDSQSFPISQSIKLENEHLRVKDEVTSIGKVYSTDLKKKKELRTQLTHRQGRLRRLLIVLTKIISKILFSFLE